MWPFVHLLTLSLLGMSADAICAVEPEVNSTEIYSTIKLTVTSTLASLENVTVSLFSGEGEIIFLDSLPVEVNAAVTKILDVFFTAPGSYLLKAICEDSSEYNSSTSITVGDLNLAPSSERPDNISSLFDFTLTFNNGLQVDTEYNCSLSLLNSTGSDYSDRLVGTTEKQGVGSVCSFNSLRVKNKGTYLLSILIIIHSDNQTGNTNQTYETSTFVVSSEITSISFSLGSTVDTYKDLSPLLTVKGNDDVDYLDGYSVSLTMSDDSSVVTTGSLTDIETSTKTLNFYLKTSGSVVLTVNATSADETSSVSETYNLTVNPAIFVFSSIDNSTSKDDLNVSIEIKTASDNPITSSKLGTYLFNLELEGTDNSGLKFLVDSAVFNKEYSANNSLNMISLPNVRVLSSGSFEFKVSSSDLKITNETSNTFLVTNDVKSLTHSNSTPDNYFDFNISFEVFGDDDEYYLGSTNITIQEISSLGLNGDLIIETSTGQATVTNLYFEQSGSAILNYTAGEVQVQDSFTVSKSLLEFNPIEYPQNSSTYFNVTVNVKNSDGTLEDLTYNHTVNLGLVPLSNNSGSEIEGELSITGPGPFVFTNLRILSSGEFQLNVTSEYLTLNESDSFEITNKVKNIEIEVADNTTIYFNFTVKIQIFGEDDNHYLGECNSTLKDDNDDILFSYYATTGIVLESIYLTNSTATKLQTTCGGVTGYSKVFTPKPLNFEIEIFGGDGEITSESDAETTVYALIKVVDNYYDVEDTNYNNGEYPFYLKLVNSSEDYSGLVFYFNGSSDLTLDGEFSGKTSGGVANVSLLVLSSGVFELQVSSGLDPEIDSGYTYLDVTNFVVNYTVAINSTTVYLPTDIEITLYGNDDNEFILPLNATIYDSFDIDNSYTCENDKGSCRFSGVVVTQIGDNVFESSELVTNLTIEGLSIKIFVETWDESEFYNVTTSRDEFELITRLYDNSYSTVITHDIPSACNLTLLIVASNSSNSSGEVIVADSLISSSTDGELNFTSVYILSSGEFSLFISSSCSYIDDWESDYHLNIENFVKNISLKCDNEVYVNFPLTVEYNITGDDDNPFIIETTMIISEDNEYDIEGERELESSQGDFKLLLSESNLYTLNVTSYSSDAYEICEVDVLKNTLFLISSIDSLSYIYNSESIEFSGQIYGKNEGDIEIYDGKYTFTIKYTELNEKTEFKLTSKAGIISDSLHIKNPGTYNFQIQSHDQVKANFKRTILIAETLEMFSYNSSDLTHPVNTLILFPVQLYGYSKSLYKNETNVTLDCDEGIIVEEISIITETGEVTFRLYSIDKGSYNCKISATDYNFEKFVTFTIDIDRGIADQLCYIEYNSNDCYICIENSRENIEGNCTCADHSTYNISSGQCVCDEDYISSNDYCVQCGFFYEASEVTAYYSELYDSIIVDFGRKGNNGQIDCSEAFTLPENLAEFVSDCSWVAEKSLAIYFNQTVSGDKFDLIIDPLLIQRQAKGNCGYNVEELNISVTRIFDKPTPVTTLFAPSQVSAACGTESVYFYTTTYGSSYVYDWSSDDINLNDLLSSENGTSVTISLTLLENLSYDITLKVTNSIFKTSDSKTTTLVVSGSKVISVGFTVGNSFNYKVSESLPLKASILDACGESEFSYSYTLLENSEPNPDLLDLIKSNSPSILNIRPGYFTAGKEYTISVTVESSNSINGTGTLVIEASSSDIIIDLSYSDGTISTKFDLEIVASAVDPDNLSNQDLTFKWTCLYNSGVCKDNNGKTLVDSSNSESVYIDKSKLKDDTDYLFTVYVSSPGKTTKSAQVELYASSKVTGLIRLTPINGVVNSNSVLLLLPYIDVVKGNKNVEWVISPAISGIDLNNEYLLIPRETIESGKSYIITVYLGAEGSDDNEKATATTSITVNTPPVCDSLLTEDLSKNMYLLTASNCQDPDSDSYILYQFGYYKNDKYSWLTRLVFEQTSTLRIPEADKAAVRVCDSSLSCIVYDSKIPNERRYLSINITEYKDATSDFDMIPSSVVYYSQFIESYDDDFVVLFADHKFYFNSIDIDENAFDLFVTVHSTLINNALANIDLELTTAFEALELILNVTDNYGQSMSGSNFEELVQIIGLISDSLEVQVITNALETISSYAMKEIIVNMLIENDVGNLKYSRTRLAGSSIFNSSIVAANLTVEFPDDLNIEADRVYDIILVKFIQDDGIFEVTFKETGSVANGLSLYGTALDQDIESNSSIQVEFLDSFDTDDDYECVYLNVNDTWQEGGCEVTSISSNRAKLTLEHLTVFSIRSTGSNECDTGAGPISTMCVITFLIIFASIVFTLVDKSIALHPDVHRFLLLYPITSLFFKQAKIRRTVIAVQILTSGLLLLALIGAFHHHWDDTNDDTDNSFDNFYGRQLRRGAAGWALTQAFTIPIFVLNAYLLHLKNAHYITLPICGFFIVGSFIGVIVMTVYYCQGWTEYWISNWLIFFFMDLLTLEIIYSFIMMYFIRPSKYSERKVPGAKGTVEGYDLAPTSRRNEEVDVPGEPYSSNYDIVYEASNS